MEVPEFKSALEYAQVRDFAYPEYHPLHYGVPIEKDAASDLGSPEDVVTENGWEVHRKLDLENLDGFLEQNYTDPDDIYARAMALFDFSPENENEIELLEGQVVWVSYRHGQGWLVAENLETGATGLIPEEYVQFIPDGESPYREEGFEEEAEVQEPLVEQAAPDLDQEPDSEQDGPPNQPSPAKRKMARLQSSNSVYEDALEALTPKMNTMSLEDPR